MLKATIHPSYAHFNRPDDLYWRSDNPSIVSVNQRGVVSGHNAGKATIRVKTVDGGFIRQCAVEVRQRVTGVRMSATSETLKYGEWYQLSAEVIPSNAFDKSVTWRSSNTSVATVNGLGWVYAAGKGTADITVRTNDGGYSTKCTVRVRMPVTGVSLSPTSGVLDVGKTLQLTATVSPSNADDKSVSWRSSNTSVATVDGSGKVKAIGKGESTITVTTNDQGRTASCTVIVRQPVTGVSVNPASLSYNSTQKGAQKQLTATVYPPNASNKNIEWSSSNTSAVQVNKSGLITVVGSGKATIYARAADGSGKYGYCSVNVDYLSIAGGSGGTGTQTVNNMLIYRGVNESSEDQQSGDYTKDMLKNVK
jgi:uncharacterized protein YjdB